MEEEYRLLIKGIIKEFLHGELDEEAFNIEVLSDKLSFMFPLDDFTERIVEEADELLAQKFRIHTY